MPFGTVTDLSCAWESNLQLGIDKSLTVPRFPVPGFPTPVLTGVRLVLPSTP